MDTIGGQRGQDYLLTFQVERGYGRQAWLQTIVARRSSGERANPSVSGGYDYLEAGAWRILLGRRALLFGSAHINLPTVLQLWEALA